MRKIGFIVGMISLLFASLPANALQVDNLFFIGDSLTDQGNVLGGIITPRTNGNTYAFYLGQLFGKLITPSAFGGTDFARFGASTGVPFIPGTPAFLQVSNGLQQIDELLQNFSNFSSRSIFVYWLGSNDIILSPPIETGPLQAYPLFNATTSVNDVLKGLNKLNNAGAKNIVVLNLPALERTPAGLAETDPVKKAAYNEEPRAFNQLLLNQINNSGLNIIQLDIYSVMNYVLDNFSKFGYTNITDGCCPPAPTPCPPENLATCAGRFFYDDVHPSDKTHRLIADFIFESLTAPDFFATLAELPLALVQAQYATLRQQLYPAMQNREVGKFYPFISGNFNAATRYAFTTDRPTYTANGANGTVGLIRLINEDFALGGALGQIINLADYDTLGSQFTTHGTTVSLFASYQKAKFFINGIVNYARFNFSNIERHFYIGPVMFSGEGNTTGNQYGTSWQTGYNLTQTDTFQFGPIVNFEYQKIDVNGYNETGADVFDLAFDNQSNSSLIAGAGLQATKSFCFHNTPLTANAFFTVNKQFLDGERDVFFRQTSFNSKFASLPVNKADFVFANAGVNLAATFKNGLIASVGYMLNYGDQQFQSNLFMVGLTLPL